MKDIRILVHYFKTLSQNWNCGPHSNMFPLPIYMPKLFQRRSQNWYHRRYLPSNQSSKIQNKCRNKHVAWKSDSLNCFYFCGLSYFNLQIYFFLSNLILLFLSCYFISSLFLIVIGSLSSVTGRIVNTWRMAKFAVSYERKGSRWNYSSNFVKEN